MSDARELSHLVVDVPAQLALALILLPKQKETRRWSRPDALAGLALLTASAVILRLELVGLLIPLALQAWYYERVDWLEGAFIVTASGLAATSQSPQFHSLHNHSADLLESCFD